MNELSDLEMRVLGILDEGEPESTIFRVESYARHDRPSYRGRYDLIFDAMTKLSKRGLASGRIDSCGQDVWKRTPAGTAALAKHRDGGS